MAQTPLSELSIPELLRRARDQEEGALDELFRRCQPRMDAWASKRAAQESSGSVRPSDITQEAAQRAFQRFSSFRGATEGEWFTWLKEVLLSQAEQLLRGARRQKRLPTEALPLDGDEAAAVAAPGRSPSQFTSTRQEVRQMLATISQLPEDQRDAVQLCFLEELRVAEVAHRMERSNDAVASLVQRGVKTLRARMAGEANPKVEDSSPLTAAFLAYMARREAGQPVAPDAFAAEHPDCADELRSMLHWVERLLAVRSSSSS